MKNGLAIALAAFMSLNPLCVTAQTTPPQNSVPDAPRPQAPPPLTGSRGGTITPGIGSGESTGGSSTSTNPDLQTDAPSSAPPSAQGREVQQTTPPQIPETGEGSSSLIPIYRQNVNYVDLPVTVKDKSGKLVPGLTWRDFKVYEDNTLQPLARFTVDPFPLSIAFVIDQSLTVPVMERVNNSLGAIQGALTPYDEIAIFSYNNGAQERTGFTGSQTERVPYVLAMAKVAGTDPQVPINTGAFASCNIRENGNCVDPNIQAGRSAGNGSFITIPKDIHTLNDAILAAAKELSSRPKERRRIVYVISDGKEYGSKAKDKDVIRYLQTNNIAVYGTLVGDSARWGEGYLSRFRIPVIGTYDNILVKYSLATGGSLDSEGSTNGIEHSYAKIAEEARTRYTLGYYTHQLAISSRFHKIDVRVNRPGLEVIAKPGYFFAAEAEK